MAKITINQIAEELNLSRNTISKVLNQKGGVSEKTEQLVLNHAKQMGYKQLDQMNQEEKQGIQVYIGNETQVQSLRDCSIETATYELKEGGTGTVGIIGPKRMDYENVVDSLKELKNHLDDVLKKKKT